MTAQDTPADETPREPSDRPLNRTISPIAGRLGGLPRGRVTALAGLLAGIGVLAAIGWGQDRSRGAPAAPAPARQIVPFDTVRAEAPPTVLDEATPDPSTDDTARPRPESTSRSQVPAPSHAAEQPAAATPSILAYSRAVSMTPGRFSTAPAPVSTSPEARTELDDLRRGSRIGRVQAAPVGDLDFMLLAGALIPCVLETAMDSATPGYVTCLVSRDIYSAAGSVVLLEKGSRVLGEYRAGMRRGQSRLFVLWTRAVTPAGIAIDVASPAADPLGRAGFDGDLDTHFWDRFGGASLMTMLDAATAEVARGGDRAWPREPSDAAALALQHSIDIPPSLRKPAGAEVAVFVASDLDFSSVYRLKGR